MTICRRKVQNEDFYIIFCDDPDYLYPFMFGSLEACSLWMDKVNVTPHNKAWDKLIKHQGIISRNDILKVLEEQKCSKNIQMN